MIPWLDPKDPARRLRSAVLPWRLLPDLIRLTWRSMASRPLLLALHLTGIIFTFALLTNASFFAQAVDRAILSEELSELSRRTGREPFSMRIYLLPSSRRPLPLAAAERAARNVAETLSTEVGLALKHIGLELSSGSLQLLPLEDDHRYSSTDSFLDAVEAVYIADVDDKIERTGSNGQTQTDQQSDDRVIPVSMHADLAAEMGVGVGEEFRLALNRSRPIGKVQIAGFWRGLDPSDPFWFKDPNSALGKALLLSRDSYQSLIEPSLAAGSRRASWHIVLDDTKVDPRRAADYVRGLDGAMTIIDRYLPGARLDVSPLEPLRNFVGRQYQLTRTLLLFNLPALSFLIYFLILAAKVSARSRRREVSIWMSRGMSRVTLAVVTLIEIGLLILPGLAIGVLAALGLARLMGNVDSFFSITERPPLPVSVQGFDMRLILLGGLLIVGTRLLPQLFMVASAALQERETARPDAKSFWRRHYLDILLLAPTLYLYRLLTQRGSFAALFGDPSGAPFDDPLLVLVPALFILATTLLTMRLFSPLVSMLEWVARRLPWLSFHLAMRQLSRQRAYYEISLILVIALLAVGIYTQSMATSLEGWLADRVHYEVGADLTFLPVRQDDSGAVPVVAPLDLFTSVPDVERATRVGDYPMRIGSQSLIRSRGRFLAIDRLDFPGVSWFREDFARESLGELMNRLALDPSGVLLPRRVATDRNLEIGDPVPLTVSFGSGVNVESNFTVAGFYDFFPTVYRDELVLIGSLDHLFVTAGTPHPYGIWLDLTPGADPDAVVRSIGATGLTPLRLRSVHHRLDEERSRFERVGIFATISVGFLAAALLASLALLIGTASMLQERIYQFHVLRTLGADRRTLFSQLLWEFLGLTGLSALAGLGLGSLCSLLFSPFFRLGENESTLLPPLIPLIDWTRAWQMTLLFGVVLVLIQIVTTGRALQNRLMDTLRLGAST